MINLKIIYGLLCFFISIFLIDICFAEEQDSLGQSEFERILEKFYKNPQHIQNLITIETFYGMSKLSFPSDVFNDVLSRAYLLELRYGFTRIDDKIGVDNRLYYASEFGFISNITSHFKPSAWKNVGITSDNWKFGFGYKNGYGYIFENDRKLILYHTGIINWSQPDFETNAKVSTDQAIINQFDRRLRFGNSFEAGVKFSLTSTIDLNLIYEQNIIYNDFKFFSWFGSSFLELIIQRAIDLYGVKLIEDYPDIYPVINFVAKNSISLLLYNLKRDNMFFPFKSDYPLSYDNFKIGFTFLF